jgi:hypothetical protein
MAGVGITDDIEVGTPSIALGCVAGWQAGAFRRPAAWVS